MLLSRRDIDFLLFEWLRVQDLTGRQRFSDHSRETFGDVLDLCSELASTYFAPYNRACDLDEPAFDGTHVTVRPEVKVALDALARADLIGMSFDYEVGGSQLPGVVAAAGFSHFHAANIAIAGYALLSIANANLLTTYGTPEQVESFAKPILRGDFSGTMCLSEPQAGSSLADIVTRAEPQADGTYRIFGSKMWISGGDHDMSENIVHLVLARVLGAPAGTQGISLFIVPKILVGEGGVLGERNDVVLAGLNHKMGYRGTVNAVLNFGDGTHAPDRQPGAVGYLVGAPDRGLNQMFHMMNEARLGVGLGASALGYTGFLKSVDYAKHRPQGRAPNAKDPTLRQVPIIEHADVKRMLLAQKSYVEGALALTLYCERLVDLQRSAQSDEEHRSASLLLDILTPIVKSWPSQWCVIANDLAIQVHGGAGYTREYDVEQHYRDNRLNSIHEGTQGIQSLDLLGRKVVQGSGAALHELNRAITATIDAARIVGGGLLEAAGALEAAWLRIVELTEQLHDSPDTAVALANSVVYLEAMGHTVVAWIWLHQAVAADGRHGDFYDGKRQAARYFFTYELPRVWPQLNLLARLDRTTVDMRESWF